MNEVHGYIEEVLSCPCCHITEYIYGGLDISKISNIVDEKVARYNGLVSSFLVIQSKSAATTACIFPSRMAS